MASRGTWRVSLVPVHAALFAFVACSGDDTAVSRPDAAPPDAAAGGDAGAPPPAPVDSGADAGPFRAPFGLDARPRNPACVAPKRPVNDTTVAFTPPFPSLPVVALPTSLHQAPGDPSRFYATTQTGRVYWWDNVPTASTLHLAATVGAFYNGVGGELGLLGMAFDPAYATTRKVYLSYTSKLPTGDLQGNLERFKTHDGGATFVFDGVVMTWVQPGPAHAGGKIVFGPDGYLYLGLGEGNDPPRAQDLTVLNGKILRVAVGATGPAGIPPSNPFAGGGPNRREIFAWGLRNPWQFSFDAQTGDLWAGDVGEVGWEEVGRIEAGGNYGWPLREGAHCFDPPTGCARPDLIDPVWEYPHADLDTAVVGGFVYRGKKLPGLFGSYVFADYVSGRVRALSTDALGAVAVKVLGQLLGPYIPVLGEDLAGELHFWTGEGKLLSIVPAGPPPPPSSFPATLSDTGCVEPKDPRVFASGVLPYTINAPFWSDGAEKRRGLALPDGARIAEVASGDLDLPIGSVVLKEFSLGGKRIETRYLVRHDDGGWAGYTYEWNDAETAASRVVGGKARKVGAATWIFPTEGQCLGCHTAAAGRTLGLELAQLDREHVYTATNRLSNQIATFDHIGLFAAKPSKPAPYVDPLGTASTETRARVHLHTNCSFCHRPGGGGRGTANFSYPAGVKSMAVCNVDPVAGDLGKAGAKLLVPGNPGLSILLTRSRATDLHRMPPYGSRVVDTLGTKLLEDWITGLKACP